VPTEPPADDCSSGGSRVEDEHARVAAAVVQTTTST
jgi:hypothetical protein